MVKVQRIHQGGVDDHLKLKSSHPFTQTTNGNRLTVSRACISGPRGNAVLSSLAAIVPSMHIPVRKTLNTDHRLNKKLSLSFRLISELLEEHAATVLASKDLPRCKLARPDHLKSSHAGNPSVFELTSEHVGAAERRRR